MAERLSGGNNAIALLANTLATGAALMCLIAALGPISGAHFNPAVSFADAIRGGMAWRDAPAYSLAQLSGAMVGVAAANTMFGLPPFFASHHVRGGLAQWLAEFVATFGLLLVIWGCVRARALFVPFAVAAYIVSAYWFTSSSSFANPAVTIARSLSDTFAGIRPQDAPGFILAQLLGAACATLISIWLLPLDVRSSDPVLLRHGGKPDAASICRRDKMKRRVLFVCVRNAARSQMAETFLNRLCPDDFEAESAGLEPGTLDRAAVAVMCEIGIDISGNQTKGAFDLFKAGRLYSYVITVCDEASAGRCPIFPGQARRLHWTFADPALLPGSLEQRLARTRVIRDEIRAQIRAWCNETCSVAVSA